MAKVYVDVELDEFDTDELIEELESRNKSFGGIANMERIKEIFYALKFGQDAKALELTKVLVQDATGMVL